MRLPLAEPVVDEGKRAQMRGQKPVSTPDHSEMRAPRRITDIEEIVSNKDLINADVRLECPQTTRGNNVSLYDAGAGDSRR